MHLVYADSTMSPASKPPSASRERTPAGRGLRRLLRPASLVELIAASFLTLPLACAAQSPRFCWRSLDPVTGPQNLRLTTANESLARQASGELWLTWNDASWNDKAPKLRRFSKGAWVEPRRDELPGLEPGDQLTIAASAGGGPVAVLTRNDPSGSSALHVAQWRDGRWAWLGAPLLFGAEPFTHANDVTLVVDSSGHPVVAWTEELHVKLSGLFVARWDGRAWKKLGDLHSPGPRYYLGLTLAVGPDQGVWLAWRDDGPAGPIRVARFDGKAWEDIGTKSPVDAAVAKADLLVDPAGRPWLAWSTQGRVALARWDGKAWASVPMPAVEAEEWQPKLVMGRSGPLLCSTRGPGGDRKLFCSEWSGSQWLERLAGLHVVEGVSSVNLSKVIATEEGGVVLLWDEAGGGRRTRVVEAARCANGESPAEPPRSVDERSTWPQTVDAAARQIADGLSEEDRATVARTKREQLIQFHHGWGTGIRNGLGLWRGNEALLRSCGEGELVHPDNCSMVIIEAVWARLQPGTPQATPDGGSRE